jgi:hypothetical protein
MELGQHTEIPIATYQLAVQYQVGEPLALYSMRPRVERFYQVMVRLFDRGTLTSPYGDEERPYCYAYD